MEAALEPRLDSAKLLENLGRPESVAKMLKLYANVTEKSLSEMEAAEQSASTQQWLAIAHSMKGAAQNVTAKRMASLCREAEEIRQLPDPRAKNTLYHLQKEFSILREMIEAGL